LPSQRVLHRAALTAVCFVAVLMVGVVLPAETGRDPSGLGEALGLSEMGRIKVALAREAASGDTTGSAPVAGARGDTRTASANGIMPASVAGSWRDSITVTLQPAKSRTEAVHAAGDTAYYEWTSDAGEVYFHRHGEPPDAPKDVAAHSYDKGMATADQGALVAEFDGVHGWFWRNRSAGPVRVTLRTRGTYAVLRVM
jgi:hypothetical protein